MKNKAYFLFTLLLAASIASPVFASEADNSGLTEPSTVIGTTYHSTEIENVRSYRDHVPNHYTVSSYLQGRVPIARAHIKEEIALMKRSGELGNGTYEVVDTIQPGEFIRVYTDFYEVIGVGGNSFGYTNDVKTLGGHFIKYNPDKMSIYVGRALATQDTILYSPQTNKKYRTVKKGEALRVYNFNNNYFYVGNGYYIKNNASVKYYVGEVKIHQETILFSPDKRQYKKLAPGSSYRVYNVYSNHLDLGNGYYVVLDMNKSVMEYVKN